MYFRLRAGEADVGAAHVSFVAKGKAEVDAAYAAIVTDASANGNGTLGGRPHYHPNHHTANVLDPDGYNLDFAFKS